MYDGDFEALVHHAQAAGCRVEVMAFGKSASSKIKNVANYFKDLDKNSRRYFSLETTSRILIPKASSDLTSTELT